MAGAAEQRLLFRVLQPGDSQPGWEVGLAAGLAQVLQAPGCFHLGLLPVLVLGEAFHCWPLPLEPLLHCPETRRLVANFLPKSIPRIYNMPLSDSTVTPLSFLFITPVLSTVLTVTKV